MKKMLFSVSQMKNLNFVMGDAFDGSEIIDLSITMERTAIIDFFILYYRFK